MKTIYSYEIWCRTENEQIGKRMFRCKTIYRKWDEEDIPFRRRAKRIFKKYKQENQKENRKFFLLEND